MDEKKYLRQIRKRLKCGTSKKREIIRQIQSDIALSTENGMSLEDALEEIGTPADVAEEFNENMSTADIKSGKREKIGKALGAAAVIILLLTAGIVWAFPKTSDISESRIFSKDQVMEQAKQIIQYIDGNNIEALRPLMTEKMQKILTEQVIVDAKNSVSSDFGSFQSWGRSYMTELSQMGQTMAVLEITASYENTSATYRISFDEDMLLAGLYIR